MKIHEYQAKALLKKYGVAIQDGVAIKSMDEFEYELNNYIDYYNNDRIKTKLKGLSPVKFRTQSN